MSPIVIAVTLGLAGLLLVSAVAGRSASAVVSDVDFSIGVDPSITGAALPCDSSGAPTATCDVPLGAKFKVSFYGLNAGDPGYDVKYDRTYVGPNKWNLGPPDGKIRSMDIVAAVYQYGQDCA